MMLVLVRPNKRVAGFEIGVLAKSVADVFYPLGTCGGPCCYRHDVGAGLARGAGIVAEEAQDLLV